MRTGSRRNCPVQTDLWGKVTETLQVCCCRGLGYRCRPSGPLVCLNTFCFPLLFTLSHLSWQRPNVVLDAAPASTDIWLVQMRQRLHSHRKSIVTLPAYKAGLWGLLAGTRLTCLCHLTSTFIKNNKNTSNVCTESTFSSCATALFLILRLTLITKNEPRAFVVFFWTFSFVCQVCCRQSKETV